RVPAGIGADAALRPFRDVAAGLAEGDLVLDLAQGLDQALDVLRVGLQEVEGDPLGTLGTDPGQAAELVDQVLDHTFVHASTLRPTGDPGGDGGPVGHSSRITVPPRSRSMTAGPAAPASTMSSSSSLTEASSGSWSTGRRSAGGDEGESAGRS